MKFIDLYELYTLVAKYEMLLREELKIWIFSIEHIIKISRTLTLK